MATEGQSSIAPALPGDAELALQLFYVDDQNQHQVLAESIVTGDDLEPLELRPVSVSAAVLANSDAIGRQIGVKILPKTDTPFSPFGQASWVQARLQGPDPLIDIPVATVPEPAVLGSLVPIALAFATRRRR